MKNKKYTKLIALAVAFVLIAIDQMIKQMVVQRFERVGESINLIKTGDTEILNLTYHLNDGAAFGFFGGKQIFLIVIVSIVLICMTAYLLSGKIIGRWHTITAMLVIAGGGGNLIDRIFNDGKVVDYIHFEFINFPIFNFADICAVVGCFGLFALIVLDDVMDVRRREKKHVENADANLPTDKENTDDVVEIPKKISEEESEENIEKTPDFKEE